MIEIYLEIVGWVFCARLVAGVRDQPAILAQARSGSRGDRAEIRLSNFQIIFNFQSSSSKTSEHPMSEKKPPRDLEERTFEFARDVREFVKQLPKTETNREDVPQLVRASGSVAANYIEANDALGKKDFLMRLRISRKESKESGLFLRLVDCGNQENLLSERGRLVQEAKELKLILSSIIQKAE